MGMTRRTRYQYCQRSLFNRWTMTATKIEGIILKTLAMIRMKTVTKEFQRTVSPRARRKLSHPISCLVSPPDQSKKLW